MTISTSPLGLHIGPTNDLNPALAYLRGLAVRPKYVKVFDPGSARAVKAVDPGIITIVRHYVDDTTQAAYLARGYEGGVAFVESLGDTTGVDYLEGLNENLVHGAADNTDACVRAPDNRGYLRSGDAESLAQANQFYLGFVAACVARGIKPLILSIAVGNLEPSDMAALRECVQAALNAGGAIAYHAYGPAVLLYGEVWYANRGPLYLEAGLRAAGVTGPIRWIYTEGVWDWLGSLPQSEMPSDAPAPLLGRTLPDGTHVTVDFMHAQMDAYYARLLALGIVAATPFTFWGDGWAVYDYARIEGDWLAWFAAHFAAHVGPPIPPEPPPLGSLRVNATPYANFRTAPYYRDPVTGVSTDIGNVYSGVLVQPLTRAAEWYKVLLTAEQDGHRVEVVGWMHASVLEPA